ncbi:LPD7 domain-containing protein [Pantoea allii]|uniref:LPD7 domain-containing protein n=1 Tax=Pantoea allii TaxID=574096 RepID=UPI003D7B9468
MASEPAAAESAPAAPVASEPAASESAPAAPVASEPGAKGEDIKEALDQAVNGSAEFISEANASVLENEARQGTAGLVQNYEDGTYEVLVAITDSENDDDVFQLAKGLPLDTAERQVAFLNGHDLKDIAALMREQLEPLREEKKLTASPAEDTGWSGQYSDADDDINSSADDMEAYAAMMGAAGAASADAATEEKSPASDPHDASAQEGDKQAANAGEDKKKKAEAEAEAQNGISWTTSADAAQSPKERIDLEGLIARFTYRAEKDHTAFMLDGKDAFYDYATHMRMASPEASQSEEMILAAVLTASKQHPKGIEITGTEEFKDRVLSLISEYNIDARLSNPEQRVKLLELKKASAPADDSNAKAQHGEKEDAQQGSSQQGSSTAPQDGMRWAESDSVKPEQQSKAAGRAGAEDKSPGDGWEKGVIIDHGPANYEWKEDESRNYFVKLKNEHGEKVLWGKDLERAVKDAGVDNDRLVTIKKLGFVDVEVDAPVRDENDKIIRYEKIQTKRNEWEVKPVYPQPAAGNEQAYKPSELVPYDAATFQKMRTTVQQLTGVDLSREPVPEKEIYWFLPNGKPAPEEMAKPAGYKLPQESKTAGALLLVAPHKKGETPDYALFESRKGFMQGVVKDKESGEYHSVIGKVNTRKDNNGEWKTYMTLSAINKNAQSGIVLHGYGHVDQAGKGLVYRNTIANEKQPQHLQPASDDVKNKAVMKQLFHPSNAAKRKDDERREQTHAPVAKSAPRP